MTRRMNASLGTLFPTENANPSTIRVWGSFKAKAFCSISPGRIETFLAACVHRSDLSFASNTFAYYPICHYLFSFLKQAFFF